jgi:hypothetical protein
MDTSTLSTSVQSTPTFELLCCRWFKLVGSCSGSTIMSKLGRGGQVGVVVCAYPIT